MPPEPIEVLIAEFDDATQHHLLEVPSLPGVAFGPDGTRVPGALLIHNADGTPAGLWLPVPPAPPPGP